MDRLLKKNYLLVFIVVLFLVSNSQAGTTGNIDFGWKFSLGDSSSAQEYGFDDSSWRLLDLPHDWSVEGDYSPDNIPQNSWLPAGVGWYRKTINVPDKWLDRKVLVRFEGIYMNSRVWINGQYAGGRPYGFMSISCDLTDYLKAGRNTLAVRVDNTPAPTARFYHGSGIYGHVDLMILPKVHIEPNGGIFVRTEKCDTARAMLIIDTEVINEESSVKNHTVIHKLKDKTGTVVAESSKNVTESAPGLPDKINQRLEVDTPHLWSPKSPYLYTLESTIETDGRLLDLVETPVGIRTIRFDSQTGFWINGQNIKLKGVCEHQEMMPFGLAVPDKMIQWRLATLKQMGCNAIRTAHNPFTPTFYDLCDQMGIMVMDEIFDGWHRKHANDYGGRFFEQWWKKDVKDWVRRDRNHPCVIMYSIGNETGKTDKNNISGEIKKYDTTRPTTGGTVFYGVDVSGFNGPGGMPGRLEKFHQENPERPVVLTEVPHTIQTRGFYRVMNWWRDKSNPRHECPPYGENQIFFDGHQRYRSSYDNAGVRINARTSWKRTRDMPWISGEFRWTGFDCFGESQFMGAEFPKRIYNAGVIDLAGIPKDHFYFYQSQWTKKPMVHVLPHWTHTHLAPGTTIPVVAYSNCNEVELFHNGTSLGKQVPGELLDFVWKVPFKPGELKAIAYRKGKPVAQKIIQTAVTPEKLKLEVWNNNLATDRRDNSFVTISALDSKSIFVPWADNQVDFRIEGPVKLRGFENGDPMDGTAHRELWRKLFYGKARGFFQSISQGGPIEITAGAILGDTLFQDKTQVAIDIQRVSLRGPLEDVKFSTHYTLDGSEPDTACSLYNGPIELSGSTIVKAIVLRDGKPWMAMKAEFKKGPELHITDPRWENVTKSEKFPGPFDKEILGKWTEGNQTFIFKSDGILCRKDKNKNTPVAYWWYDFPKDPFENPDDAGSGELFWLNSKQKSKLELTDQKAQKLRILTGKKQKRTFVKEQNS